jgi:hypothetical protein
VCWRFGLHLSCSGIFILDILFMLAMLFFLFDGVRLHLLELLFLRVVVLIWTLFRTLGLYLDALTGCRLGPVFRSYPSRQR